MAAVLVHIDLDGDHPHPSSLAALAAGRLVASSWGATLYAAMIAKDGADGASADSTTHVVTTTQIPGAENLQAILARAGADKIVVALSDAPITPLWATVGTAWQGVLDHLRPRLVLFGADSPSTAELAPRTGARIGARLLLRARPIGIEDVELRDRDGGYVRVADGGAAVVLVGNAPTPMTGDDDIDVIVLAMPGGTDERIELAGTAPIDGAQLGGTVIVLGDDVAGDPAIVADARKLATKLNGRLVGTRGARESVDAVLDRNAALAPELCVQLGNPNVDVGGATVLVRVGATGKTLDGAVPGAANELVAELVQALEAFPRG